MNSERFSAKEIEIMVEDSRFNVGAFIAAILQIAICVAVIGFFGWQLTKESPHQRSQLSQLSEIAKISYHCGSREESVSSVVHAALFDRLKGRAFSDPMTQAKFDELLREIVRLRGWVDTSVPDKCSALTYHSWLSFYEKEGYESFLAHKEMESFIAPP